MRIESSKNVVLGALVVIALGLIVYYCVYLCCRPLMSAPPKEKICGAWAINKWRSNWKAIDTGSYGELVLNLNGTFKIHNFPDFWSFPGISGDSGRVHKTISGTWNVEEMMKDYPANIQLHINEVDGREADYVQAIFFLPGWNDFFLNITIGDPDSNEDLTFRRAVIGNGNQR